MSYNRTPLSRGLQPARPQEAGERSRLCESPWILPREDSIKEIATHLLAYNLIRLLMRQAVREHGRSLHRMSFTGTLHRLRLVPPLSDGRNGGSSEGTPGPAAVPDRRRRHP